MLWHVVLVACVVSVGQRECLIKLFHWNHDHIETLHHEVEIVDYPGNGNRN